MFFVCGTRFQFESRQGRLGEKETERRKQVKHSVKRISEQPILRKASTRKGIRKVLLQGSVAMNKGDCETRCGAPSARRGLTRRVTETMGK